MFSPLPIWDTYWKFAYNRHEMWWSRHTGGEFPWTEDPILLEHRFTNSYRVLDRVSQYLLREVQYKETRSQAIDEVFFRTLLFKIFNKISTWELIEEHLGSVSWQSFDAAALMNLFDAEMQKGTTLYSAAYIIPDPRLGHARKHANHIALLMQMMEQGLPYKVANSSSLEDLYHLILDQPGLGPFLAFQYTIDLNYSSIVDHDESSFVVAGPGALDGITKCFSLKGKVSPEDVIMWTYDRQHLEFERLGLPFKGLFGRPLQPIDLQNCYCETSKYTRKSHPDAVGSSGRMRIKQKYKQDVKPLPPVFLPPKWGLTIPASFQ